VHPSGEVVVTASCRDRNAIREQQLLYLRARHEEIGTSRNSDSEDCSTDEEGASEREVDDGDQEESSSEADDLDDSSVLDASRVSRDSKIKVWCV